MDGQKKKILVIDDDQFFLRLMKDFLSRQGYHVETASDGKVGFSMAVTGEYELITLDLRMPMLNGVESMRSIKTINPDQKIIIISGYLSDEIREELVASGIGTFLTKPVNLTELVGLIKDKLAETDTKA